MLIKKIALPIAALAMTALVGCGSDSSSNSAPANGGTIDQLPASVDTFFDVEKYTCTETVNKCKTVAIKGQTEPAESNATPEGRAKNRRIEITIGK